ncbi:hypothetical protein B0H14DRAFT_2577903 [Mycena olivaceomarginata]|nr:hypothetical protein B0H14DRAFT_3632164 [Mycena olivaceomarginata]KAJ7858288.1 hypothetical protein B0H14DRAFT_2577903 [Mycena olivaceomarginata]
MQEPTSSRRERRENRLKFLAFVGAKPFYSINLRNHQSHRNRNKDPPGPQVTDVRREKRAVMQSGVEDGRESEEQSMSLSGMPIQESKQGGNGEDDYPRESRTWPQIPASFCSPIMNPASLEVAYTELQAWILVIPSAFDTQEFPCRADIGKVDSRPIRGFDNDLRLSGNALLVNGEQRTRGDKPAMRRNLHFPLPGPQVKARDAKQFKQNPIQVDSLEGKRSRRKALFQFVGNALEGREILVSETQNSPPSPLSEVKLETRCASASLRKVR